VNKLADKGDTGGAGQEPADRQKLVGAFAVLALLVAIAIAAGVSFIPKPSFQADAETVAVQKGVAALKAGAFKSALDDLEPIAKKDNAQAAYWLGRMYEEGLGVKQNADTAITWYRKAAEGGWAAAKLQLGEIYFKGTEELQDFKKARKWLEQAARDGNARAQLDLGRLYANGWGGDKDPVQAYVWYEFAAKQGNYEAQRLRDGLLKAMRDDEVSNAQNLTEKMAPQMFGQGNQRIKKTAPRDAISNK